jgi:hypothetical protein
MNNALTAVLAELVRTYHVELKKGGVECRLALPALTEEIAVDLQKSLRKLSLNSYLVVPRSQDTNKEEGWIRAEGVTSVRQGDMIVIVWPGEMSRIQDSVIGAGGAIRNFAFSDEWPWIDTSNEYFRFDGPVLEAVLDLWQIGQEHKEAYRAVLRYARDGSRNSMLRAPIFLDTMIGQFDPTSPSQIPHPVGRLLYHLGLPYSAATAWEDMEQVKNYHEDVQAVIGELEGRLKDVEGRSELLNRITEIEPDAQIAAQLRSSLSNLINRITTRGDGKQDGILALHGCWDQPQSWYEWELQRLWTLLDIPPAEERIEIETEIAVDNGLVADDGKSVVVIDGSNLDIKISYRGISSSSTKTEILVLDRRTSLFQDACADPEGQCSVSLSYDELFPQGSSGKKKSLRVVARRGEKDLATARISVIPCGPNQPLLAIVNPGFKVLIGRPPSTMAGPEESSEHLETTEPVHVSIASWDASTDVDAQVDDAPIKLVSRPNNKKVLDYPEPIDPGNTGSGKASFYVSVSGQEVSLNIEAKDIVRGEFTLERELIKQLEAMASAPARRAAVKRICDIFLGKKKEAYPALGGMDDPARLRTRLARHFEQCHMGKPLIVNLFSGHPISKEDLENFFASSLGEELPSVFKGNEASPEVVEICGRYAEARQAVMNLIRSGIKPDPNWPDYAALPIFNDANKDSIESAIQAYLEIYVEQLSFVKQNLGRLSWSELFRLSSPDCVVQWDDTAYSRSVMLVGPWHPLTIAKRFMVQAALVASAQRHLHLTNTGKAPVLALLLDQVNSFRWMAFPTTDGSTFDSFYASSTSDPGWHVAFVHELVGTPTYAELATKLRHYIGLEISMLPSSREQVAKGYFQDFFNAYPARRAISVVADATYSPNRLFESAQALLYDGAAVSTVGRQLPGGVHIAATGIEEVAPQEWREPPICLYKNETSAAAATHFRDIRLVSPGRAESARAGTGGVAQPRGRGPASAFCCPVKEVVALATGSLSSRAFERDAVQEEEGNLGGAFSQACALLAALPDDERVMSWHADLPTSLDHLWTVIPGNQVDPAVFVKYVTSAASRGESLALWDYSMSLIGSYNSYFVLSQIPGSISQELNKSPVLENKPLAPNVLSELGRIGMAFGSESLRSGNKALGVIGMVGAVRLFLPDNEASSPIKNTKNLRGFLLPVDSFREILGEWLDGSEAGERLRADLVAFQLGLLPDGVLGISFSAIECKYTSSGFGQEQTNSALQQAHATLRRVQGLLEIAQQNGGIPERLALLSLVSFGLRLSQEQLGKASPDHVILEREILQRILDGKIRVVPAKSSKIVVITDCNAGKASWTHGQGLAITLAPGHWPGISETLELKQVRERVAAEFEPICSLLMPASGHVATERNDGTEREEGLPSPNVPKSGSSDQGMVTSPGDEAYQVTETRSPIPLSSPQPTGTKAAVEKSLTGPLNPILLGTAGQARTFYDPQSRGKPLDNYNVMITGSSGKGKTQLIKSMVSRLREQDRNVLLLDFKNDFASDAHFVQMAGLQCQFVTFDGLPFNPLIPAPLRRPGSAQEFLPISEHINGLVDIFKRTFSLGDQQEVAVKNAIRECFEERGIQSRGTIPVQGALDYPDFNDVGDKLASTNPNAYNRLDPLFDLGIFSPASRLARFDSMLSDSYVVDLSQIQSDRIKDAVAKMLVMSAHRYYNAREHSGHLRQFFVFDEAHRVLDSEFMLKFVRECRAYGVGVLLSSQYPTDFPPDVSASLNTKILHGNGADRDRTKDISRLIGGAVEDEKIMDLSMFQAIVTNAQYTPQVIQTIGYPMMLVLDAIKSTNGIAHNHLDVPGIDPARLNVPFLIENLKKMGLVEEVNGLLHVCP